MFFGSKYLPKGCVWMSRGRGILSFHFLFRFSGHCQLADYMLTFFRWNLKSPFDDKVDVFRPMFFAWRITPVSMWLATPI